MVPQAGKQLQLLLAGPAAMLLGGMITYHGYASPEARSFSGHSMKSSH
jgi:hypothetical protein